MVLLWYCCGTNWVMCCWVLSCDEMSGFSREYRGICAIFCRACLGIQRSCAVFSTNRAFRASRSRTTTGPHTPRNPRDIRCFCQVLQPVIVLQPAHSTITRNLPFYPTFEPYPYHTRTIPTIYIARRRSLVFVVIAIRVICHRLGHTCVFNNFWFLFF